MTVIADHPAGSRGGPVLYQVGNVVGMVSSTMTARAAAHTGGDRKESPGHMQMVFKDGVSFATLRRIIDGEACP